MDKKNTIVHTLRFPIIKRTLNLGGMLEYKYIIVTLNLTKTSKWYCG